MKATFTKIRLLKAGVWLLGLVTGVTANAQRQNLIFEATFENTNAITTFNSPNTFTQFANAEKCCSYSITRANDQVKAGNYAAKFDIRRPDPLGDRHRAELVLTNEPNSRQERWYGMSIFLPADFIKDPEPESMFQWHEVPDVNLGEDWLPSPLQITIQNDRYDCSIIWDANPVTVPPNWGSAHVDCGSVVPDKGKWTDWVFHIKWAYDNTGILEVWKDGVKVVSRINMPNTYNDQLGTYFKLGLHKWTWINSTITTTTQRVMWADEVRIGNANATYNDVAPTATATPPNQLPTANAGNDINITLPVAIATLSGSGSDPDGTISSYQWSKVSGPPTFTLSNGNLAIAALTGLIQGTYVFRLTVTDNRGGTASDDVTVTVNPLIPPPNQAPTANAGNNINLTLPANSTTLSGSGTDTDGTIAGYAWTRVSGPTTFTMGTPNAATTTLSGLVQGTYVFRLTVTDNNNATGTANVTVTVNPAPNQAPTANAGNNIILTLPTNNTTLNGSGTDVDGTIAGYAWTRVSGPTTFTMGTPNAATTTLSGLVQGTYVFRLTVTDNSGATGTANVTVTVNPAPNQAPTANAGNNITLTLPTNNTTLNGSGVDVDGTIAGYAWTRVSGPTTFTMGTPNAATTTLSGLVQGTYVFRLTVTDNSGATGTANVTVTVNPAPNQAPTANAGNDINITLPTNNTTLNGSGTDVDGTISNYAWTRISGPTNFTLGTPNAASSTLANLVQGTYVFRLTVTDNNGATGTANVTVTVNPAPNQAPTANAGNDISITLPANSTTLIGSGADPDGTIANYAWAWVSGPATYTLATPNAASSGLSNLVEGVYVFRLTVTDNSGATATDNITVTVNAAASMPPPPNQAPTANAGNDITITLPTNNTTLNGSGADTDGTIASYTWSRVSGPTAYTFATPNAASTTVTGLVQGVYVFRLTVTDNVGATATANVTVTVNAAPNQAPTANAGNDITITLPTNNTTLNGSGADTDGTIASYTWSRVSGPTAYTFATPNAASTTVTGLVQGVYVFRLTVTDNAGATATANVTVTVNAAPNQAPTANAGNDITITLPTNTVTLNGSGTDPDGTIAGYTWSRVSGPAGYTIVNSNSASTAINGLVQGVYVFRLTVTDNVGATATANVTVTVNAAPLPPNQNPVANAGNDIVLTLPTNSTLLNGSTSTDPDGNIVSYAWAWVSGPAGYTIANANAASTNLTNLVQGVYIFRLTVTDNRGGTATDDITITVNAAPNQAPTADAGTNITIQLPVNSTTLTGTGIDRDGTISRYQWTRISGPANFTLGNVNAASTSLTNLIEGTYVFRLTVTDNNGATATADVTVTVRKAANQKPKAKAGNNRATTLVNNTARLDGDASYDPDGTIVSYQWSQVSGPSSSVFSSTNGAIVDVSNLVAGDYTYRLTVTDNNNDTDTASVMISVVDNFRNFAGQALYPNPAVSTINIVLRNDQAGQVTVKIFDVNGKKAMSDKTVDKPTGYYTIPVNVDMLKPGVYVVETILGKHSRLVTKFVKQ